MSVLDPSFKRTLKRYGAGDFSACYNCGTCTAVCNLSEKNAEFPRKLLRYGMLGMKEEALADPALWLCYACGSCSDTCPRDADPKNYMAALRRYAVARSEPSGLTRLLFTSNPLSIVFSLLLALVFGFFMLTLKPDHVVSRWIFEAMPYEIIHNVGLIVMILTVISMVVGVVMMLLRLFKGIKLPEKPWAALVDAVKKTIVELISMKRYRNCDNDEESFWRTRPVAVKPWFVHLSIMWGFIGLLVATAINFILKDPGTQVWLPTRLLGTISGIALVYGSSLAIYYRLTKIASAYKKSSLSDWLFLGSLWFAGISGFWMEIAVTADWASSLNRIVFLLHTVVSMELVLLFAFSKFAHAFYRPIAIFAGFLGKK
ncbi:MAG: 4Fe-4S dicluster domain-containing protein [Spirochaetota bacterium]